MARARASVPLILASTSPRRRDLLAMAGIPHRRQAAGLDEEALAARWDRGERTLAHFRHLAAALALAKAEAVARRQRRPALVLGADTLVVLGGRRLGKPRNAGEARTMLWALSGRRHWVVTGIALIEAPAGRQRAEAVTTQVTFRTLTRAQVDWYAATGEPMDKAGGYGIQGCGGALVASITGDYWNVVGLPLGRVIEWLAPWGLAPWTL